MNRVILNPALVVGALIVLGAVAFGSAEYTSTSRFCNSCREMNPYHDSWQHSTRSTVPCKTCHNPPGFAYFVKTKTYALREVYVHFTKGSSKPIMVTRHVPPTICRSCHPTPGKVALVTSTFAHAQHSQSCTGTGCHQRLVHTTVTVPLRYQNPATMSACFTCHDKKTSSQTCSTCHAAPHETLGTAGLRPVPHADGWAPADFTHPQVGPHVGPGASQGEGERVALDCTQCRTAGYGTATCSCHGGGAPSGD